MIVNKNGKVVANVSQPTLVFETLAAYNAWYATLPGTDPKTSELNKFVIVKKYETVEEAGMVLFRDDVAAMKASTNPIDGAVYVTKAENELYRYNDNAGTAVWTQLGGAGGVTLVANHAALPAVSAAKKGVIYVEEDTNTSYVLNSAGTAYILYNTNVIVSTTAVDPSTQAAQAEGTLLVDTVNNKTYIALGLSATPAWLCICDKNSTHATEFADSLAGFQGIKGDGTLNDGYAVEDRFFVARDTKRMYVIEAKVPATTPATYEYVEVSTICDNIVIANTKTDFPATGDKHVLYVAKDEGILYIWDDTLTTPAYSAVGGSDEVQVYQNAAALPSEGKEGRIYCLKDECITAIWDNTTSAYLYIGGADEVNVYATVTDFPTTGKNGKLYIAKDTGLTYIWDIPAGGSTAEYMPVGGTDNVKEYANVAAFPTTGKADMLYFAKDTRLLYAWTGSAYEQASGHIPSYTQAEWNTLISTSGAVVPEFAYITDGLYDFSAYL